MTSSQRELVPTGVHTCWTHLMKNQPRAVGFSSLVNSRVGQSAIQLTSEPMPSTCRHRGLTLTSRAKIGFQQVAYNIMFDCTQFVLTYRECCPELIMSSNILSGPYQESLRAYFLRNPEQFAFVGPIVPNLCELFCWAIVQGNVTRSLSRLITSQKIVQQI